MRHPGHHKEYSRPIIGFIRELRSELENRYRDIRTVLSPNRSNFGEFQRRYLDILELEILGRICELINSNLTLNGKLEGIVDIAIELLDTDAGSISLWDTEKCLLEETQRNGWRKVSTRN